MRKRTALVALTSAVLMTASMQAPAFIAGQNDYQVSGGGGFKIISRWRLTYSTDSYTDSCLYGFIGAKVDSNPWSSIDISTSPTVAQIVNAYCYSGDYSFTGTSGAGESLTEVDSAWSWVYLFDCY